jgi:hypothetical protein
MRNRERMSFSIIDETHKTNSTPKITVFLLAFSLIFHTMTLIERCALQQKYHTKTAHQENRSYFFELLLKKVRGVRSVYFLYSTFFTQKVPSILSKRIFSGNVFVPSIILIFYSLDMELILGLIIGLFIGVG